MSRVAAIAAILLLLPLYRPAVILAQSVPPAQSSQASAPATAEDIAKLRQTLQDLRAQLAALHRRLDAIEEQLNAL